ncbi:unnamed protein product [Musa acuminata subsp. malaccensis]|uniref:(wild Malaysian banana) hypothetical protein n=1 Tax=Musa acuminata subsp. malaccensis TaxID=214687 RepID=A0A8D7FFK4_MUSAM|nr:unnamed protein product [Musa acuminata subsp. malaccensis]
MTSSGAIKLSGGGAAKEKGAAVAEVKKKVDGSGKPVSIVKKKPVNVVIKPEVRKGSIFSSNTVTKTSRVKAQKKVYSLPGQKYDIPEEREPLRMFYESLLEQIPSSEMAESWMMEHGLLSPERAKKAYERKQKRQQQLRRRTPIKSTRQERPATSQELKASKSVDPRSKKRINYSNDEKLEVKLKKSKA